MADPIQLKVPEDYLNQVRPRIGVGQGYMQMDPQFQFPQTQFDLPAEPVAPLPPTSIEQRQGAMSTTDKFFAALRGMAAGLVDKPDPTMAGFERQFERDQQRYLSEKGEYEANRRSYQQLKAQAALQAERVQAEKDLQRERVTHETDILRAQQAFLKGQQAKQLANEEFRTSAVQWGEMIRSQHPATVQAGLAAIRGNPEALRLFGNLPDAEILDQAKALQAAGTTLQAAQTRALNAKASMDQLQHDISTGKIKATREMRQAAGVPVDSILDIATLGEIEAMRKINPALAQAMLMSRLNQSPLGMLVGFKLADEFKKNPNADAGKVIDDLMNQLKETSEADQLGLVRTQQAYSQAITGAISQPPALEAAHSLFRPVMAYYFKKLGIDVDVSKLGLTGKEGMMGDLGKFVGEEAKKAEDARRGRGGPLLPGRSKP